MCARGRVEQGSHRRCPLNFLPAAQSSGCSRRTSPQVLLCSLSQLRQARRQRPALRQRSAGVGAPLQAGGVQGLAPGGQRGALRGRDVDGDKGTHGACTGAGAGAGVSQVCCQGQALQAPSLRHQRSSPTPVRHTYRTAVTRYVPRAAAPPRPARRPPLARPAPARHPPCQLAGPAPAPALQPCPPLFQALALLLLALLLLALPPRGQRWRAAPHRLPSSSPPAALPPPSPPLLPPLLRLRLLLRPALSAPDAPHAPSTAAHSHL